MHFLELPSELNFLVHLCSCLCFSSGGPFSSFLGTSCVFPLRSVLLQIILPVHTISLRTQKAEILESQVPKFLSAFASLEGRKAALSGIERACARAPRLPKQHLRIASVPRDGTRRETRLETANYISQSAMREIAGGNWGKRLRASLPALDYTSRHGVRGVASCGPRAG